MRLFTSPSASRRPAIVAGLAALLAGLSFSAYAQSGAADTEITQASPSDRGGAASVTQASPGTASPTAVGQIGAVADPCVRPVGETRPARCAEPEVPLDAPPPQLPPPVTRNSIDVDRVVAAPDAPLTPGGVPAIVVIAPQ